MELDGNDTSSHTQHNTFAPSLLLGLLSSSLRRSNGLLLHEFLLRPRSFFSRVLLAQQFLLVFYTLCVLQRVVNKLQCAAVCCIMLQRVVNVMQCGAVCRSVVQYGAVCRSVWQCGAACYSVLQRVAACCSVLQRIAMRSGRPTCLHHLSQFDTLQHDAIHCNTL